MSNTTPEREALPSVADLVLKFINDPRTTDPGEQRTEALKAVLYEYGRRVAATPAQPVEPIKKKGPLQRGVDGKCMRSTCLCEREGLGPECVWLGPLAAAQPVAPAPEGGAMGKDGPTFDARIDPIAGEGSAG